MADYFETEQWDYRFPAARPEHQQLLGNTLPVDLHPFTVRELKTVLGKADPMMYHQISGKLWHPILLRAMLC